MYKHHRGGKERGARRSVPPAASEGARPPPARLVEGLILDLLALVRKGAADARGSAVPATPDSTDRRPVPASSARRRSLRAALRQRRRRDAPADATADAPAPRPPSARAAERVRRGAHRAHAAPEAPARRRGDVRGDAGRGGEPSRAAAVRRRRRRSVVVVHRGSSNRRDARQRLLRRPRPHVPRRRRGGIDVDVFLAAGT
mmetsp:Transcript_11870/g.47712  ORF Transcript_11870/g.47712 Transcript_11870/m.47712 type:complete len:201 (-) Transcript_11870:718-1320(-)